jgi:hypothetical protein
MIFCSRYVFANPPLGRLAPRFEIIGRGVIVNPSPRLLRPQNEKPTDDQLTKKQQNQIQNLIERLDELAEMIGNRLVEYLRRKNEALKQASKRERSDPMAHMVPSVSPCSLNDDSIPLRLLVKLGKSQEAATAYSARRSLLLLERYEYGALFVKSFYCGSLVN